MVEDSASRARRLRVSIRGLSVRTLIYPNEACARMDSLSLLGFLVVLLIVIFIGKTQKGVLVFDSLHLTLHSISCCILVFGGELPSLDFRPFFESSKCCLWPQLSAHYD